MNIETKNIINPIWDDNYTAIFTASSNEYVPYLSVYLQSIIENSNKKHNYDIVVFECSITKENKEMLKEFIKEENISLRFFDPSEYFEGYDLVTPHKYISKESYFRLCAPIVFQNYKRIIYTDIDLIFNEDPQKLYNLDMHGAPMCAALDLGWNVWIVDDAVIKCINIRDYTRNTLNLKNINRYYNAGVLLLDIEKLNKENIADKFFEQLGSGTFFLYQDQCIINKVLNNKIGSLPFSWNHMLLQEEHYLKADEELINYAADEPKYIIHWINPNKPWVTPEREYSYIWWQFARKSPFYEIILKRMCNPLNNSEIVSRYDLKEVLEYNKNIFKYKFYKFMSGITLGKSKERYKSKMLKWKNKVDVVRRIKRGW